MTASQKQRPLMLSLRKANDYVVARVNERLRAFGDSEVIFKSDQEEAMLVLKDVVAREWQCKTNIDQVIIRNEEAPVGEHESNGGVENIVRRIQGQVRTLRNALE